MVLGPSLLARILELTRGQVVLVIVALALVAWLADVALRRRWSASRRRLLASQLRALGSSVALGGALWLVGRALAWSGAAEWLAIGVGLVVIVAWLNVGLRVARVFVFEWLFANSEREGVPLLLVDIFTIVASVVLFGALLHAVFLIEVTSLLATSAVVSVVLGLALQDTLGQLFAGVSLQLDRPFRLGDWVEVHSGGQRVGGQVLEISWRATLLLAIGEELISIPNKSMAQGLVLNFSGRERPFVRGHVFRVPLDADVELVKRLLVQAAQETEGVVAEPRPLPLLIETTESWIAFKMVNFVTDYGAQFTIGDAFQTRALELLAANGVRLAAPRLQLVRP
ncbi:MAG: mechanosensitive ion channel family protein [Labilithrix sp.]|nr:mechanosensitive ion channel family protein [Labilithrix sp.]MCW5836268.1 mechanosensitive ion channel family protein [Labilithrix sp.]